MTNLLGRAYDRREADIAEAVWDIKPDGIQIDPFIDEDLIGPAKDWSAAKKEQILLGALMARGFDGQADGADASPAAQAEIDPVIARIAEGFFGELSTRMLESLENEATARAAAVRAELGN